MPEQRVQWSTNVALFSFLWGGSIQTRIKTDQDQKQMLVQTIFKYNHPDHYVCSSAWQGDRRTILNTDHLVSILVNILSRWGRQQYNQHISISPYTHLSDKLHQNCSLLTIIAITSWGRSGGPKRSGHWVDFMKLFLHYQNILLSHIYCNDVWIWIEHTNVCQIPLKCCSKVVLTWLYFAVRPIQTSKIIFVGYLS